MAEEAAPPDETTPPPVANPDAQTTVNDFLDYTEFFPSDLVRSLRLIGDLDQTYVDATQTVHQLTVTYGKLPTVPAAARPDPVALRRDIALALDKAIYARESSYAEASRLVEVAERHKHRIGIIKRKLQAQPEPPSRDPTPAPVSPQVARGQNSKFGAPHVRLAFDGRFGASSTARPRDRYKARVPKPGVRIRTASFSDSDDSEVRSIADLALAPKRLKAHKDKPPRPQKVRVRAPGSGTNVHSSFAGISTSNALARLSPPPENARAGSKWAPWFKLTEYEMAVLRKKMKKNAVWTPSETMIKRQLEAGGRGQEAYDREKARCEETGDEFLDEEPAAPTIRHNAPHASAVAESQPAPAPAQPASAPAEYTSADTELTLDELQRELDLEDADTPKAMFGTRDTRQSKRDIRRRQALHDAQELENATLKIKKTADWMLELDLPYSPASSKRSATKPSNKRKRDSTPPSADETSADMSRNSSPVSQDSADEPPEPKKPRLTLPATNTGASTPQELTPVGPSLDVETPELVPEIAKSITVQVPLAPAGPGTPKNINVSHAATGSQTSTPAVSSPALSISAGSPAPHTEPSQSNVTAASSRPRRESVAPPKEKPSSPDPTTAPPVKKSNAPTPGPEAAPPAPAQGTRPRSSRGHVPTPKAQSEEPKPHEPGQSTRELRRHSNFSQSALATPTAAAPTGRRTRRKAPPKGEISHGEDGQMTVTNVKRAQGTKIKKRKPEEESGPAEEADEDEERYCICDGISEGSMILCDNHCEKEWFHFACVGLKEGELPARRAKWYCPDCRGALGTDAYGNPKVPPPLPGRRGNRGWSH